MLEYSPILWGISLIFVFIVTMNESKVHNVNSSHAPEILNFDELFVASVLRPVELGIKVVLGHAVPALRNQKPSSLTQAGLGIPALQAQI